MERTGKRTSGGIDDRASDTPLAGLPARSELAAAASPPASNVDGLIHSSLVATNDTLIALARLLGQAVARQMMDGAAATASAVPEESRGCDQGEVTR